MQRLISPQRYILCCIFNRSGSVMADFTIKTTSDNLNLVSVNQQLAINLRSEGFNVSETAFSQSGKSILLLFLFLLLNIINIITIIILFAILIFFLVIFLH